MSEFVLRHHNEINPNEYRVYELNGGEYTVVAATYKLKKGIATFGYWDKNILTNRYEMVEFTRDGVKSISLIIDGQVKP